MATIVKIKGKTHHAILLGVGHGMFKTSRLGYFKTRVEEEGEADMAALSTSEGKIIWCNTEDLEVIEVDGKKPSEVLEPYFSQ